ncbi:MAG: hypothetical protein AB1627_15755 [Chloroflexota bacterium]
MTEDRAAATLRAALERRRPVAVPRELAERLDRIPIEVRPLLPLPVRATIAGLPWVVVAAAGIALAVGPQFLADVPSGPGGTAAQIWDPANPGGGIADVGPFGLPWVPLLPFVAAYGLYRAVARARSGQSLVPRPRLRWPSWRPEPRRRMTRRESLGFVGSLAILTLVNSLVTAPHPVSEGAVFGPGPDVSEIRSDGPPYIDPAGLQAPGRGPNYVYRVRPGGTYTYVVSLRNDGPLPITILGMPAGGSASGLGLLRDPTDGSAKPANVVAFHPVELSPGAEVALVVAAVAGPCADPTLADEPPVVRWPTGVETVTFAFVYDILGWRTVDHIWAPFAVTVPGCY